MNRAVLLSLALHLLTSTSSLAATCEHLSRLVLPHTSITLAESVQAGTFTIPGGGPAPPGAPPREFSGLPAFCRVAASIAPSSDSDIRIEVWLPLVDWNGKFMGVGNGGWSGAVNYAQMAPMLKRGYAVASTDTGHQSSGGDARWALGHPDKQIDFGYRAVHEMTLRAKEIIAAFYEGAPKYSYWNGCSSGGKQGLKEAQRFPADYDGIIAGAPANYWTHLTAHIVSVAQSVRRDAASQIPQSQYPLIHEAVLRQCDARDGVRDGLLEDPRQCAFDPAELQCRDADAARCLTAPQVAALESVYRPLTSAKTGALIFPGLAVGSELVWGNLPQPLAIAESHFRYLVFADPSWDFKSFDVDRDLTKADAMDASGGQLNAIDPDLSAFKQRGGRLLQYHGWNDQQIAAGNSINYYESVVARMGGPEATAAFYRLFMVPGMAHCRGGEGATDQFDAVAALEQWVERGTPPEKIVASSTKDGVAVRTRPLCPYPMVAQWTGSGSTDDVKSFACVARR